MNTTVETAVAWIQGDPDPETRAELQHMVDAADLVGLERAMGAPLAFGTAGIRGEVGAGSGRMNRATVIRTTAGLVRHLQKDGRSGLPVVIGFDARPTSRTFAEDAAGVMAAAGIDVEFFPEVTPTPIVAYTARRIGAGAAVVVTASHNPPADNGYKVYGANSAQIIPPEDSEISAAIDEVGPATDIPRVENVFAGADERVSAIGDEMFEAYMRDVDSIRPSPRTSNLTIAYTPMHGVGGRYVQAIFERAGHTGLNPVVSQFEPDGTFPTVLFPNPEEAGALDLCHDLAERIGADAIIANDPDADRLAAAVAANGDWRQLSGNELGALLGDYVLRHWEGDERPIVASSIVSSPILGRLAADRGAHHEVTLTGFKWIVDAALALEAEGVGKFAFGFEEALGYTVGDVVRDKDGISAALIFSDLVAELAADGRTGIDRLHEIWRRCGLWVSAQHSIVRPGPSGHAEIESAIERLGDGPPDHVGDEEIADVTDYRRGAESRRPWLAAQDLIELRIGARGRVLVRPSGTEPKLKIYVDLAGEPGEKPDERQSQLLAEARTLADQMGEWLAI